MQTVITKAGKESTSYILLWQYDEESNALPTL